MMVRRSLHPAQARLRPPGPAPGDPQFDRRGYRIGDWVFVGTLLVIALTGFVLEGVRIAMSTPGYGGTQFGGWVIAAGADRRLGARAAPVLRHGLWWSHGLLAITFVASIPYTKATHMLASFT